MPTRKPLVQMIPDIVRHIQRHRPTLEFNLRLYEVDEGQLRKEVEDSLRKEMVSVPALNRALQRIPAINILKKAVDKLSKVYAQAPIRQATKGNDQDLVDALVKTADVDQTMSGANRLYNLQRMCAVEFFVQNKQQRTRVLAGHQFLPYSDDPVNPLNVTVFIKFAGTDVVPVDRPVSSDGTHKGAKQELMNVDVFHLYSDQEFLVIDSRGVVRLDKMNEMGMGNGKNPYGTIPYVYINASKFELVPYPNKTGLDMAVLIPKLLTDLNYAAQFLSHSILWVKNASLAGAEIHPDSIIDLGDSADGQNPEIGTVDPKTDITQVLSLIEFQMSGWLSSIGIKAATQGSMLPGREASGFAKVIDEGDATHERTVQAEAFKRFEKDLWMKFSLLQNYWSRVGAVDEKRKFTPQFVSNFAVRFGEMKHAVSESDRIRRVESLRKMSLMSERQAIKELNPDFTPEQLEAYLKELREDRPNAPPTEVKPSGGTPTDPLDPNRQ